MGKKSIIKDVTYGVCTSLLDLIIWQIALVGASVGKTGPRGVRQTFQEADQILQQINHKTIAATWYQLTKKRLVSFKKRNHLYSAEITEYGKSRLNETFPRYHKKRPWDGKIYLLTYDIPEKVHTKRDLFREYLRKINCKLLQESTWLTPFNPRQLVSKFISKHHIPGAIIVSDVGKDGGIGETTIQDLLIHLYLLENINARYENFMRKLKRKSESARNLMFEYFSILKDDPQLPFELLPKGWLGNKAYFEYEKLRREYILNYSRPLVK